MTIGVFDGVHRGHRQIIGRTVERARQRGLSSVVLTFDPHPSEVVRPGTHPPILTSTARKAQLLEGLGVDVMCVIPFTLDFSRLEPDEFVHLTLVEQLHAAGVVVGENFRFGRKAAGDVALLRTLGSRFGFEVETVPIIRDDDTIYSSTYIRSCVDAGDVVSAAAALGREHRLEGVVVRGDLRGRTLGFPTANLEVRQYAAVPADGVYAGHLRHRGRSHLAAISIGTNPTFAGRERRIEAYALDFDGDLYGEHVALDFTERLHDMIQFDSVDALREQMARDVERTREIVGS